MGIVNAHEQLRQGIRQGKFLGGIMDKIIPNEITSFMNSAADKLMPCLLYTSPSPRDR